MSPMKHYDGPLLPGAEQSPNPFNLKINEEIYHDTVPTTPKAEVVDNPDQPAPPPPEERRYQIDTVLTVFPNGTFGVNLRCEGHDTVGNGEHPELAMVIALHQLWSQIDRPRCAHCGQVLPEEPMR